MTRPCSECGKRRKCEKLWRGVGKWAWVCGACLLILEEEEDGYVIQLT